MGLALCCCHESHHCVHVQDVITRSPPSVILLELNPLQMTAVGAGDAPTLLQDLYDLGYTDMSHSGYALLPVVIVA